MADNKSSSSSSAANAADAQDQLLENQSEHDLSEQEQAVSLYAKYTAKQLMEDCPYVVALKTIDTSLWGVPAPADASEAHATTWVAKTIHDYHLAMVWDNHLFDDYLGDFEGWTKEMFLKVERGVYTGSNRARIADSLYNMIATENALEWDPAEFQSMDFDSRSKAYKLQQNSQRTVPATIQQQQPAIPLAVTTAARER
ncbi:hypothetical protein EJ02DRAFT_490999 [Clathrospora elynae]|uniref:Uncharacterized protein n=1 Tax=Clathrospora elynae TaxID=706981 RepID=A0A6A5S468_9PLEO|nr:hypothetical protein EJ02DRAFT_490999 [Clathrospora elynae]